MVAWLKGVFLLSRISKAVKLAISVQVMRTNVLQCSADDLAGIQAGRDRELKPLALYCSLEPNRENDAV